MELLHGFLNTNFFAFLLFMCFILKILKRQLSKEKILHPPEPDGAWPILGHLPLLKRPDQRINQPHLILGNIADKYGPIFSIKTGVHRTLIISNWELAKQCFTTNDKAFANRPDFLAAELMGYDRAMFGFSPYGQYWREVRKIATVELLSNHRLQFFRPVRESEIKAAINDIYQLWEKEKNETDKGVMVKMKQFFGDITLNVIFMIIFGKRYYTTPFGDEDDSDEWREAMNKFFELSGKYVVSDSVPFLRWMDIGGYQESMKKTAKELDVFVQSWLDEHKRKRLSSDLNAKGEDDFMSVMLSILDDAEELPDHDADTIIKATCLALTLAASDTTKITLTWALSLLLKNNEVLKKAQHELDREIGKERNINELDLKKLVYLQAIIKETLRLQPATPLSVPHECMEDCVVAGYHIPKGTRLLVNLWKLHRDPKIWLDPDEFRPERFLTTHKDFDVRGQNFELMPFGSGRRMCPGVSFALQIMQLTLGSLLHGFDISIPSDKGIDVDEGVGVTNHEASRLEMFLSPRLPAYLYK